MRRLSQPIQVRTTPTGDPLTLNLGGTDRRIREILDHWVESGRWWDGEEKRRFWRIEAGGLFDLSCDEWGCWRVETVWD